MRKNMEPVRLCFIGCGDHANRFIYPSLANVTEAELVAVCSLDLKEAEQNRKRHGAERAYTDYVKMLSTEQPAAAIIVGPPRLHYEAGMYCLQHGIPFFIEKPPGENLEQAQALVDASRQTGVFGQVGFMMRHSAIMGKVREIAERENLGRLQYGTVKYFTSGPYRSEEIYGLPGSDDLSYLWRYLMVQAVHPVNLAASFLGELTDIRPEVTFSGEDIVVEIKLTDADGRRFTVQLHTLVAPGYGNLLFQTELYHERRGMILTDNFAELSYYPPEPARDFLTSEHGNALQWRFATFGNNNQKMGYENEIRRFIVSVANGETPETDLTDALKTMHILTETRRLVAQQKG
jgi:predicted dehydrogenase